jgi:excisionase family DNA binding protein
MNRLLTTHEAASLLRVSPRTVLNWIERDAVPYVTLPQAPEGRKQYRIPLFGLLSSLDGNYDLSARIHELDVAVAAEGVPGPEEQTEATAALDGALSIAEAAVEQLHAETA